MGCLGCNLATKTSINTFNIYEDTLFSVILDKAPFNEGHLVILPKRHITELHELTIDETNKLMKLINKMTILLNKVYEPDGVTLYQSSGKLNDLNHLHFHLIPRYDEDEVGSLWPASKYCASLTLKETQKKLINELNEK